MSPFMSGTRRKVLGVMAGLMVTAAHAGSVTYVYTDPQGTPLAEADSNGNITATFDYTPYGGQALGTAPSGPGYTGHVNDPDTGLVYMQQRYYDPSTGRFLSTDPVMPSAGDPYSFNRFAYARNNPVINIDPDGREAPCAGTANLCDPHSDVAKANDRQLGSMISDGMGKLDEVTAPLLAMQPEIGAGIEGFEALVPLVRGLENAGAVASEASALSGSEVPTMAEIAKAGVNDVGPEMMSPKSLLPTEKPSANQVARLAKDMKANGFDQSHPISTIRVNGRNVIMDGNHRAAAAAKAGIQKIPVVTSEAPQAVSDQAWSDAMNTYQDSNRH